MNQSANPTRPIIAIDASLTGFAVCVKGPDTALAYTETSSPPPKVKTLQARLTRYTKLCEVASNMCETHNPEVCLIEGYSFGSKGNSGVSLGELGILLRRDMLYYCDTVVEVPPSVLKKFATGKGNAGKIAVASSLSKRYGIEFATDNHADSFGLVQLGMVVLGYEEAQTAFQRSAADVVEAEILKETRGDQHEDTRRVNRGRSAKKKD